MVFILVLVWSGLLVRVCLLVLLSSMGQQPLSSVGATTLILYGTTTLVLCGTHHPLWLSFCLISWFGLCLDFGICSNDIFGLWQDCEAIILGQAVSRSISPC
jgi:hypothetical protein